MNAASHVAQLLRFVAVGAVGFGIGLAVLTTLHGLAGVNYLVAYVASFFAANVAGYLLNACFTFSASSVNRAGATRYMIINAAVLGINTVALKLLVERAHIWYVTAAIIIAIAVTPLTFLCHRLLTYRLDSTPATDEPSPPAAISESQKQALRSSSPHGVRMRAARGP